MTPASAAIEELLEEAGKFARNHEHKGLVVFVDEFHEAQVPDRKSLLVALRTSTATPAGARSR